MIQLEICGKPDVPALFLITNFSFIERKKVRNYLWEASVRPFLTFCVCVGFFFHFSAVFMGLGSS